MLTPQRRHIATHAGGTVIDTSDERMAFDRLKLSFEAIGALTDAEVDLVQDLTRDVQYHPANKILWLVGAPPPPPRILVSGWACRYRMTPGGERQIMCLLLPGDFITPPLEPRLPSSCGVVALTELETVNAKALVDAVKVEPGYPTLARATLYAVHFQDMLLCEQIIRLTQQSADQRFVHLMTELHGRLNRLGLAQDNRFLLPLTQETLANVLGLSAVHLNRTLQQLRKLGLLKLSRGVVTLLDLDGFAESPL